MFTRALIAVSLLVACDKGPTKSETAAAPAASPKAAPTGQTFGAGVSLTETAAIVADPAAFKGKTVRVEGMVVDVCPRRGCWMDLAGKEPGHRLKFKVTDGEMVFPMDAKGKTAVAQGEVAVHELTLEQSKEYAEEEAKETGKAFDPASITKPTQIVRLDGTGAVFRDKI
jgi:hypothetical protein